MMLLLSFEQCNEIFITHHSLKRTFLEMDEHSNIVYKICLNNFDKDYTKVYVRMKRLLSLSNTSVTRENEELEYYFKGKLDGN